MAQTKRKRKSKHRGTAAGTIEGRGRTGGKATSAQRKGGKQDPKEAARDRRVARLDQPPSWRSAANRAGIATAVLVVFLVLVVKPKPAQAVQLAALALLVYIPMGYYTDLLMYRRRQSKKLKGQSGGKAR
ncbi:MAG: hypothetical protein ACR2ML_15040 [Solirubrobacteraceae bacterium]